MPQLIDGNLLHEYSAIGATRPGDPWTAINPLTKKREPLVMLSPGMASNFEGEPSAPAMYGFLSENPKMGHTQVLGPEKESGTKFGLLGRIVSNVGSYGIPLAGMLSGFSALGAGTEAAGVAEAGSLYSAPEAVGAADISGGGNWTDYMDFLNAQDAEAAAHGGAMLENSGMSYDQFLRSLPANAYRAPVEERSKTYDPKSSGGLPNAGNVVSAAARAAGASPGTAGALGDADGTLSNLRNILSLTSAAGSVLSGLNAPSVGETGSTLARASDGARRRVVQQNMDEVTNAFKGFDENYYNSITEAFKNYYQPQVSRQFDDASRNIIYKAPGGVGSSNFARQLSDVERDRQQAGTDIADSAQSEAQRARAGIEGTRTNLLGLAETSEDPAAFGAQAVAGAKAATYAPEYSAVGDLVSRYASLAQAAGGLENAGYGRTGVRPISFGAGGGRSSVRTIS